MTYQLSPRLFVENGPTIAAQAVHRRHDILRAMLSSPAAGPASPNAAANSDLPACAVIRFAL